jgi:3-methylornithine--L-lysine ligase
MRVAVVGGRLQGLEAVYLAKKADWEVVLIDKDGQAPAREICDYFICLDAARSKSLEDAFRECDLIIPALENRPVLQNLQQVAGRLAIPIVFDPEAYDLAASKTRSDRLFAELGLAAPGQWPQCNFPLIAKPAGASGSEGVTFLQSQADLDRFTAGQGAAGEEWVIQEYLEGPSYSIEVIGCKGHYLPLPVTDLEMDASFDCKRVRAPSSLDENLQESFAKIAVRLASGLNLQGIMDVEVVLHDGCLKVLEIDARLPSQTPTAVLKASGINMLELLAGTSIDAKLDLPVGSRLRRAVIFEHIAVNEGTLEITGEHVVATAGPLVYREDFYGADEALTNYQPGHKQWMATLIITAENWVAVDLKRKKVIERIMEEFALNSYEDPGPGGVL